MLLLAGSPQKKTSSQETSHLSYCTNAPVSGQHNPGTSSRGAPSIHRNLANDKQPCRESIVNQAALITSTLPYVRALKFTEGNETIPRKRGRKKSSKNKNDTKQNTKINKQSKTAANKKGANNGRQRIIAKKPPELSPVSFNNISTCPTPTPVNFTPSSSVHTPTPFALRNFPICSPPVSLPTTDQPNSPSVVPVVCPLPSSVCPVSTHTSHSPLPVSLAPLNVPAISDETLVTQAVNIVTLTNSTGLSPAVIPGHYRDSTVSSATAISVGNLTTSVKNHRIMVSSGLGPSISQETVDAGADDLSTSSEPLSMQASNLLPTLPLKHANSQTNVSGPCNLLSGSNNEQVGAEGLRNNMPHSAVVEAPCQPLKDNSTSLENVNISKDNIDV